MPWESGRVVDQTPKRVFRFFAFRPNPRQLNPSQLKFVCKVLVKLQPCLASAVFVLAAAVFEKSLFGQKRLQRRCLLALRCRRRGCGVCLRHCGVCLGGPFVRRLAPLSLRLPVFMHVCLWLRLGGAGLDILGGVSHALVCGAEW